MKLVDLPFQLDLAEGLQMLKKSHQVTLVNVANTAAKCFIVNEVRNKTNFKNIFWLNEDESVESLQAASKLFFDGEVFIIPEISEQEVLPVEIFYRLKKLSQTSDRNLFLIKDHQIFEQRKFPLWKEIENEKLNIKKGEKIKIYQIFSKLEERGYSSAEEEILKPGEFLRKGDQLFIFPVQDSEAKKIDLFGDEVEEISKIDGENKVIKSIKEFEIFPAEISEGGSSFLEFFDSLSEDTQKDSSLFLLDDLEDFESKNLKEDPFLLKFTSFPKDDEPFFHLNFFSVLPFYTLSDFVTEIKERFRRGFEIILVTKKKEEVLRIFKENEVMHTENLSEKSLSTVKLVFLDENDFTPHSFQNNEQKFLFLSDREISAFHRSSRQKKAISGINLDLINSLAEGEYVIHMDHGIAEFQGIIRRDLGTEHGTREYLKLAYAGNDKLFIPVESAEKISKFIGDDKPTLSKFGSGEWKQKQAKLKEETERIAKDLIKIYAAREVAKGRKFDKDDEMMSDFCASFPYELTPGQAQSWTDVKLDLESSHPMDRLVCGDVGFGKTEIAMRTAFKAFRSGYQTAFLAPITILAEQHFNSFQKRILKKNYGVRIELLSRFQTPAEQKKILKDTEHGLVDILIGTHRLLSGDIKFKNLGLLVIDEEQRFGVEQKENLKKLRAEVDTLTLTATPIPRTLNMSLNKLKDISTITTPPPGRLPVITEVRKYNPNLIRDRILFEIERGGQIYFLHNEVRTIEAQAELLRKLIPEASFIVAHGQLKPEELENRIRKFKDGEAQVLIASTIIENGIDLANANTLLVNKAERFGLSQLYQLRGRVGRSRTQAYAFFLYHGQRLDLEPKKRLRAIVEASELGSGFQIAMRDLEIRGAGEILGANQSGTIKTVGVTHFMRILAKTVEDMKSGEISSEISEPEENISVEIPLSSFIPISYIPDTNEKIRVYQEIASAKNNEDLQSLKNDLIEDYGMLPKEVVNLFRVIQIKNLLRECHIEALKISKTSHKSYETVLRMGKKFIPDQIFGLLKNSDKKWIITVNAIKIKQETLPLNWYEEILKDIQKLLPKKNG